MISTQPDALAADAQSALADIARAAQLNVLHEIAGTRFDLRRGRELWVVACRGGCEVAALRLGYGLDPEAPIAVSPINGGGSIVECAASFGALRAKITFPSDSALIRATVSVIPAATTIISAVPRDLYALGSGTGIVHTAQRLLRSGIVFCSGEAAQGSSLFYFQNFSSLSEYFAAVKAPPADTVGGSWPELGYAMPAGENAALPGAREVVISDVFLSVIASAPATDADAAGLYLDALAETYLQLSRPTPSYHDWPRRADDALRHLTHAPDCSGTYLGRRYLLPYVADRTKPPESMVQFTVSVNLAEYDRWKNASSGITSALRDLTPTFFDESVGSIVRWLPGVDFDADQAEATMSHEAMDSWYIHHALFNVARMAQESRDPVARDLFARSLPYIIRVARRFAYRWPIFFHTKTLDIIRAESAPGRGGETDVGGIYALVMLHAHEMFDEDRYLDEAKRGLAALEGLGFRLAYQLNTTGFAAEAALRMFKITGDRAYLGLSEICMANIFDNMWLWQGEYERAKHYPTFFGMFPLHDAPYLAAFEEMEAQGKAHDYLQLAGEDLRPSLRLLLAEYQKYALDRAWFFYPDNLPAGVVASEWRNGSVERELAIPLEDLQDGFAESGQVGQEVYGAGLPFVYVSRHYTIAAPAQSLIFSEYPMYDALTLTDANGSHSIQWRADGDERLTYDLRVIPILADAAPQRISASVVTGAEMTALDGRITEEGHAAFRVLGGRSVRIAFHRFEDRVPNSVCTGLSSFA